MTIKRKLCAFLMACVMMFSFATTAMAAEPGDVTTQSAEVMVLIDEDGNTYDVTPASSIVFDVYGDVTGTVSGSCSIPTGSYTLYYSVTTTSTIYFWSDNYTQDSVYMSGSGTATVKIVSKCTQWSLVPNNMSTSYSYSFVMM